MTSAPIITINPMAIARMTGPGGVVDTYTLGLAQAIAATAKGMVPRDTGKLADSIRVKKVGPGAWSVVAEADYALAVHEGTRPHVITPKNGRVLRFPSKGGSIVYTQKVNHPGTKAVPFLADAMASVIRF